MLRSRLAAAATGLLVLAAACGGDGVTSPESLSGYVASLTQAADLFDEEAAAAAAADYPLEEELIRATGIYEAYEHSLTTLASIVPPAEVAGEHARLVEAYAAMQREVAKYLDKAKFEGGFTLGSLNEDPTVAERVGSFFVACNSLGERLESLGMTGLPNACGDPEERAERIEASPES